MTRKNGGQKLVDSQNGRGRESEMTFEQAFYFGQQFIQFSTFLDFNDSKVYGLESQSRKS